MPVEFEKKIADFIKANGLWGSEDKVLLAISGGADSTALLHTIAALKAEGVLRAELLCVHINHQLRGPDAEADAEFVAAEVAGLKLTVKMKRVDVRDFACKNKLSIETAARQLRIKILLDIAEANNCNRIATGHHKNDNAETVLQRLARGTGFRGLGGIWPRKKFADGIDFVRPLLCVSRAEIIEYLNRRNLKWRQDKTNKDLGHRRNYIRHRLMPALQRDCSNSVIEQLFALSQSARRLYNLTCECVDKLWPKSADCSDNKVVLDVKMFLAQHPEVQVELVRRSLALIGSGERDLTQGHFEMILQLAERKTSGKRIELPNGFIALRQRRNLVFKQALKN